MKTRRKIILICLVVIFTFYVSVTSLGPGSVFALFSPSSILYLPSISMQLFSNEGNGIICVDACGPCSAWGYNYVLVYEKCKIPDRVDDCYFINPPMEWTFVNGKCEPVDKDGNLLYGYLELKNERKTFCESHEGRWSDEFNNCVGGSMEVPCDDIGASELTPPSVFGKVITQEGICISHEIFCTSMGGNSACMSYEQKGHGRDVCIAVCEFEDIKNEN